MTSSRTNTPARTSAQARAGLGDAVAATLADVLDIAGITVTRYLEDSEIATVYVEHMSGIGRQLNNVGLREVQSLRRPGLHVYRPVPYEPLLIVVVGKVRER